MKPDSVTVCIPTHRRADRLAALLADLRLQARLPDQIVVVDNDPQGSARSVVEAFATYPGSPPVVYDVQPVKNISLTRNRCIDHANSHWLAFIDDDERAGPDWLALLLAAAGRHAADVVLGPVIAVLPAQAPAWIRRGRFYDGPRMPTGTPAPANVLRSGNVLIGGAWLRGETPPFDPAYGLTGGEDGDLLLRLAQKGARIVWCDEAQVSEPVEPARMQPGWILKRALRGGQDFARHFRNGRLGGPPSPIRSLRFNLRAFAQMVAAGVLALATLPFGRHHAMYWLGRACANLGKLSVLWGWHYREYA